MDLLANFHLSSLYCFILIPQTSRIFTCTCESLMNLAHIDKFFSSQASLYSVRWYFESEEFYRFVPKEAPPARTFPVSGINVDVSLKSKSILGIYENFSCLARALRRNICDLEGSDKRFDRAIPVRGFRGRSAVPHRHPIRCYASDRVA